MKKMLRLWHIIWLSWLFLLIVTVKAASAAADYATASQALTITDWDFKPLAAQRGRLTILLSSADFVFSTSPQDNAIEVSIAASSLATGLLAGKYELNHVITPVTDIDVAGSNGETRFVIHCRQMCDAHAEKVGHELNVEVFAVKPVAAGAKEHLADKKITLHFTDVPLRQVLHVVADFTGFNVVVSDSVKGNITVRLKDVPWEQALDVILQAKGLAKLHEGSVIWVATKAEIAAKQLDELQKQAKVSSLEPVMVQAFALNYAKAAEVAKVIDGGSGKIKILSDRGSVTAESRTNQLFVADIAGKLRQIAALIQKIDRPVKQVLIEARIVEAADTFGRSLGVKLGIQDNRSYRLGGQNIALAPMPAQGVQRITAPFAQNLVNLPAASTSNRAQAVPTVAFTIFGADVARFINLELSAMETEGAGRIISSPRVIAADQNTGVIEQGQEIPYETVSDSGTNVEFKKVNLKLEVTPHVTPDGNIILDIDITKDSPGSLEHRGMLVVDTKRIKTQALVENGGTIVVGGIYEIHNQRTVDKVPLLGDIPLLGNLFKTRSNYQRKKELMVFITPRILQ